MKLLFLIFIIFSTFIGSLKNIFNKKYIYDSFPTIQFQLITSLLKLLANLIIFFFLFVYNKLFSKKNLDTHSIKLLDKRQAFFAIFGILISSANALICKEIFRNSSDYTFVSTLFSILYIIYNSLFDIFFLKSNLSYKKISSLIWIILGILFLYLS